MRLVTKSVKIMAKINYKSDFKVVVTLILNGVAVPVPDHDFGLSFFTTDDPDRVFVAGRWGGKLHNCKIDGGHVVALVDDHHLGTGTLMVEYRDESLYKSKEDYMETMQDVCDAVRDYKMLDLANWLCADAREVEA